MPPLQGRARLRGGGGRPAAPAGEVVSTAAGGTGESASRNKALVLNASIAVGPQTVAGRRSAGAGPVGRDGRERGGRRPSSFLAGLLGAAAPALATFSAPTAM